MTSWVVSVLPFIFLLAFYGYVKRTKKPRISASDDCHFTMSQDTMFKKTNSITAESTKRYKNLYFQLQNLEDYPNVLETARDELLAMFSRGISFGHRYPHSTILSLQYYDSEKLQCFINDENERVMTEWGNYLERRKNGHGPELFASVDAARDWLIQQAPVKLVDGAWLAHVHKMTTPFALRSVTKHAWQVLSEELGDGDLSKNHVRLYRQVLDDVGCSLPEGDSSEFISMHQWDDVKSHGTWLAAVGQLIISLFPNEFLPEILGFNLHYELITMDTLRAAYELKHLGINPNYFLIHVAIDNADSGHVAMAAHTVVRYLDMVRRAEGENALSHAWKRVQIGYMMSQALGSDESHDNDLSNSADRGQMSDKFHISMNPLSTRIIEIFKAKALVSYKCHLQSRARIGGRSLSEWLGPRMWLSSCPQRHQTLLSELSEAKPWIYAGESRKSLLIRELQWNGRMFGAFTQDEVAALTQWIDSLGSQSESWSYWNFSGRNVLNSKDAIAKLNDPTRDHPTVSSCSAGSPGALSFSPLPDTLVIDFNTELGPNNTWMLSPGLHLADLVGLWFTHIGLLENTINVPSRAACNMYTNILRLLRAQAGFAVETDIVSGTDEMNRSSCYSLVDIGLELISRSDWATEAQPSCLKEVLQLTTSQGQSEESSRLGDEMLRWATRPKSNLGWLLGMSLAFVPVKLAVAKAPALLSLESQPVLEAIVAREKESLLHCAHALEMNDNAQYQTMCQGYHHSSSILRKCL